MRVTIKREPTSDDDAGARLAEDGALFVNLERRGWLSARYGPSVNEGGPLSCTRQ